MKTYNRTLAIKAQKELIENIQWPHFAPPNGDCWACRLNIYDVSVKGDIESGITVESAGVTPITGCPHCHRSYCD